MTPPFADTELRAYAAALQRAIEHHCRGLLVPDDIAQECPLHAKKLNGALCAEARQRIANAEGDARVLAHCYITDNRPPDEVVSRSLAYRAGRSDAALAEGKS